jgi:serine/threonine protein kinase
LGWIQHFRVTGQIGRGGMGVVYRAEDTKLKRAVAIKAILPKYADSKEARQRFLREARSAAHVVHANIVPIFHVDESNGFPFIVMPLLEGQSLQQRLQSGVPLPLDEAWRIGRQIAQGLAAAHAKGLVHRDIKPANLWLESGPGGVVKILDFGLARPSEALLDPDDPKSVDGSIVGTPEYMSPQQALGEDVDFRTDLYSLGVVLYRLAAGQLPFTARTAHGYLVAHATETPKDVRTLNPAIPASIGAMIMRLLQKQPENRVASAQAVADALQETPPPGEIPPAPKGPSRRGFIAMLGIAIVLLGAVGSWLFLFRTPMETAQLPEKQLLITSIARTVEDKDRLFTPRTPEELVARIPLRPGDKLELSCDVPKGYQAAFFLLDTAGKLRELQPVQITPLGKLDRVRFPATGVWQVERPPGTALFLVCANRHAKPVLDDGRRLLQEGEAESVLPAPTQNVLLLMDREHVLPPFGDGIRDVVETPYSRLRDRLDRLRGKAAGSIEYVWGAAVPVR